MFQSESNNKKIKEYTNMQPHFNNRDNNFRLKRSATELCIEQNQFRWPFDTIIQWI